MNFFAIFFGTFLPGSSMNGIRDKNCFFSFSTYVIPIWLKIMPEWSFLILWIFLLFFSEFSCRGRVRTEFGTKFFFSLFLDLSHPVLVRNNVGSVFFNFMIFFAIFFGIFLPRSSMNGIQDLNFFLSFSAKQIPFWLEIMLERGFLIFWYFFSVFSCLGRV